MLLKNIINKTLITTTSSLLLSTAIANIPTNQMSIAPMLKKVMPSVVQIVANKEDNTIVPKFDFEHHKSEHDTELGSGIILDAKHGIIVTNAHVIKDASQIIVTLSDGSRYYGNLIAKAPKEDIAVIHINAKHLQALPFANVAKTHTGDFVAAVGAPFGFYKTVTTGTISTLNRSQPQIGNLIDFVQTDAAINPGNSGGPLVNMQGQIVGMNTARMLPDISSGLGFAIPGYVVKSVSEQLVEYGNVEHGLLGVVVQPLTVTLAKTLHAPVTSGTLVTEVTPNSAARKINLHAGDIISKVDGITVKNAYEVKTLVGLNRPKTKVDITFWHNHKAYTKTATLQSMEQVMKHTASTPFIAGMQLQHIDGLTSDDLSVKGLMVSKVSDHSAGLLAGIEPGDVIMGINNKSCHTITELKEILSQIPLKQQHILVKLLRDGKFMYTTLNR